MHISHMLRHKITLRVILFALLTLIVHLIANGLELYVILPWFDIITHLLGGVAVGYMACLFAMRSNEGDVKPWQWWVRFILIILFAFLVWELWRYGGQAHQWDADFVGKFTDTIVDVLAGLLGAFIAVSWLSIFHRKKVNKQ